MSTKLMKFLLAFCFLLSLGGSLAETNVNASEYENVTALCVPGPLTWVASRATSFFTASSGNVTIPNHHHIPARTPLTPMNNSVVSGRRLMSRRLSATVSVQGWVPVADLAQIDCF